MIRKHFLLYGLLVGALLLAACSPGGPVTPAEVPTSPPPLAGPTLAPTAAPGQQEYTNQDFGFSFSYPAGYELQSSFPHSVVFLAPQDTSGHRERGWLAVELASEDNAEWYADQAKAENANFGIEITSSTQVIDGQQAYVLGGLPGQDLNRQVIVVYNGILYRFTFVPDDPAAGEAYEQMEALYAAIVNSLRFLPEHQAVPPVTDIGNMMHHLERALNARSAEGIARLMGDGFALGSLSSTTAEGFTYQTFGRTDAVPLILNQLSLAPAVSLQYQVDWTSVPGSLDTYSGIFPGEEVAPILAKGWGPNGADQAVVIIARRIDSSLLWRGVFVLQQQ
ncbi:MAG TPA: hypothetical protein VIU38_01220 [Anaerolineales bacterium]